MKTELLIKLSFESDKYVTLTEIRDIIKQELELLVAKKNTVKIRLISRKIT